MQQHDINLQIQATLGQLNERTIQIQNKLDDFIARADREYVTKKEFNPIQKLVYGAVGIILTLILVAAVSFVILSPNNLSIEGASDVITQHE